ncbi:MAG: hypothetical protein UX85_C0001G0005 [Candidatus Beckwithbacteria bacterium GW2011_GWB1_47_15]|uniref:Uncharacterized protein n=1 Tax=Candidatus Beckwithbacteria bacterium GW2011_GWB1_47_15 TaxID=1618371 RepID=A0A0G1RXF1_9BACT|nr:MAG: hypothetical protein UY43_C0001G1126 [Candidatus Beckwithbacteria bacterium GW2011_GWC1_49_16]AQS30639.1 hypothetical protein [uncultured bacterium]KKU35827.1 MAG: hypothetical protein UX50_C0001G0004 [Candidatus Beckwithbacteria bacterium GW2011_GWA1_46_30]KKU61791.1 MAG: hypothetical protein UX85_C0001G0005 [Candidatus Beckwithbacteria bacterium GW2011_GWB1_47_15]KKU72655.1 MAG: hypothetical protein UX97_C0001G0525 [Candidatus Beckwithbacteria bacterium GW2011_GWA2_47_25]KKW04176.1 M
MSCPLFLGYQQDIHKNIHRRSGGYQQEKKAKILGEKSIIMNISKPPTKTTTNTK